jgi:DNA polymerase-1
MRETIEALGWPVVVDERNTMMSSARWPARAQRTRRKEPWYSTGDKDLAQLVNAQVTLVNTMSNERAWILREFKKEKFGVPPDRIIDYLALMGDTVVTSPALKKSAPRRTAKWIAEYGSLDGVMNNAANIRIG